MECFKQENENEEKEEKKMNYNGRGSCIVVEVYSNNLPIFFVVV